MNKLAALVVGAALAVVLASPPAIAQPSADIDYASLPRTFDPGRFGSAWEHYQARLAQADGGSKPAAGDLPDWSGLWENAPGQGFALRGGERPLGRGLATETTMKLTPAYAAEHEMRMRRADAGTDFDPITWCLPTGFPRWLTSPFMKQFALTPDITLLMSEMNNEIRRVYTDGRGHISEDFAYPMWFGDSIGFWDGDTLVIHTNDIKANIYTREQPAHSDLLETVEEWTLLENGLLEVKLSLYDPESLLEPHHSIRYYRRADEMGGDLRFIYWSCAENQRVVQTQEGGSDIAILPSDANTPDLSDPETWLAFDEAREAGLIDTDE
jgi:hypothetical protein